MKKKDLQKEIDDLKKRVTDLENKPLPYTFTLIPQHPLPSIPQPWYPTYDSPKITYTSELVPTSELIKTPKY